MRICILCEESKILQLKEKIGREDILTTELSPTGELPVTHRMCVMAVPPSRARKLIESAELTIIEAMNPKEFLLKHNLRNIGNVITPE
jgi:hypothetical protein